jgi:hypothetical protein
MKITAGIVAVVWMASGYDNAIGTLGERLQQQKKIDAARAWKTNDLDICGILQSARTR